MAAVAVPPLSHPSSLLSASMRGDEGGRVGEPGPLAMGSAHFGEVCKTGFCLFVRSFCFLHLPSHLSTEVKGT